LDIKKEVEKVSDYMIGLRRYFHEYPELGFCEYETSRRIENELDQLHIKYTPAAETGIVAEIGTGDYIIALRADMDALKITEENDTAYKSKNEGLMHACGHDAHMAALLGAAKVLKAHEDELNMRVRLIWQPSEENCEGARRICDEGHLKGVNEIFGLHVFGDLEAGMVSIEPGPRMASTDMFTITIYGRGGHAGKPNQCIDATVVAAAVTLNIQSIISRETNPIDSAVVTIGRLSSGTQYNIISKEAVLEGTVRTFSESESLRIQAAIRRVAAHSAAAYGAEAVIDYRSLRHPAVINDDALSKSAYEGAVELLGESRLIHVPKMMLGEDFSFYQQEVPGVFAFVGACPKAPLKHFPNHHPSFDIDEQALIVSGMLYVMYVLKRQSTLSKTFKACIFDLDGTIADTVESIAYCANLALATAGLKPVDVSCYNYFAGDGADQLIRRALKAAGDEALIHYEEVYAAYRKIFKDNSMYKVTAYEGIPKMLEQLKEKGIHLAVLSNKPHNQTVTVTEALFGQDCFEHIQGQMEGIPKKPDPAGAFCIADKFNVKCEECMYVGDTNVDMQTGNNAGMYAVGVLWGFRTRKELEENNAHIIISRPDELLDLLHQSK